MAYPRWLTTVRFQDPAQQIVFEDYVEAVADAEARIERLEPKLDSMINEGQLSAISAVARLRRRPSAVRPMRPWLNIAVIN